MSDLKVDVEATAVPVRVRALEFRAKALIYLVEGLAERGKNIASSQDRRVFLMRTITLERTQAMYYLVIDQLKEAYLEAGADLSPLRGLTVRRFTRYRMGYKVRY